MSAPVRVLLPHPLLPDRQRALVERLGRSVQPLGFIEVGDVVERAGHVRVLRAQSLLPNCERTLEQRLGAAYNPWA